MAAHFWNRVSIKQKIPVTILYILLFRVFLRLCYIREVMTHKEYDFFTTVHRTKGKK
ncbi:toxin RelE [Escherichia coli O78:H12 str. 00-3279]|nr:toxin RelE [Escherichia coli O78:H12 str. 00-3279]